METARRYFGRAITYLVIGVVMPVSFLLLPQNYFTSETHRQIGLAFTIAGLVFSILLQNLMKPHFDELKRASVLSGPSQTPTAIATRLLYVAGYIAARANGIWIAINIASAVFSLTR